MKSYKCPKCFAVFPTENCHVRFEPTIQSRVIECPRCDQESPEPVPFEVSPVFLKVEGQGEWEITEFSMRDPSTSHIWFRAVDGKAHSSVGLIWSAKGDFDKLPPCNGRQMIDGEYQYKNVVVSANGSESREYSDWFPCDDAAIALMRLSLEEQGYAVDRVEIGFPLSRVYLKLKS